MEPKKAETLARNFYENFQLIDIPDDVHERIEYLIMYCTALTDKERLLMQKRYLDALSRNRIAAEFGETLEKVRGIEARAFKKMRHPMWKSIQILKDGWRE